MRPTETKRISMLTTAALAATGNGKSVGVVSSTTAGVGPGLVACAAVSLGACCWVACLVGLVRGAFADSARDGHSRVISIIKTSGRLFMVLALFRGHLTGITVEPVSPLLTESHKNQEKDVAANRRMCALGAACIQ